jgi:hypothetical protein
VYGVRGSTVDAVAIDTMLSPRKLYWYRIPCYDLAVCLTCLRARIITI